MLRVAVRSFMDLLVLPIDTITQFQPSSSINSFLSLSHSFYLLGLINGVFLYDDLYLTMSSNLLEIPPPPPPEGTNSGFFNSCHN